MIKGRKNLTVRYLNNNAKDTLIILTTQNSFKIRSSPKVMSS